MFELTTPWWEIPLRVLLIYLALLVLVRLSGKRTVGQFTPFDLLVVLLLSEAVSAGLSGAEDSVTGSVYAAATLVTVNLFIAICTARSKKVQEWVEGVPILVAKDGIIFASVLSKYHVPVEDLQRALREADCDLKDMRYAFLEADGGISILKHSQGLVS